MNLETSGISKTLFQANAPTSQLVKISHANKLLLLLDFARGYEEQIDIYYQVKDKEAKRQFIIYISILALNY